MPAGRKKIQWLTGIVLALLVIGTRLPFIAKILFEFDSIDFAVATFRFSLEQVTPHFPGYILHILFAKCILLFSSDVNLAFVWISILLSIGSVLFLWRAGAALRGERVGVIVAALWLFTPIVWFYGEVATAYMYEAFFASALLYFGISLLRNPDKKNFVYLLFISLSLAIGARQSSIIFFLPCIIYILRKTHQPLRVWLSGFLAFTVVTILWLGILFSYSGGISHYFAYAGSETIYRSQSVFFGNSFQTHLAVIGKVFIYLAVASLPFLAILVTSLAFYRKRTFRFIKDSYKKTFSIFTILVALPAFLFYIGVYFMKAGYLLNILPGIALVAAVLLDQMAIWRAEKIKRSSDNKLLLSRPIITAGAIRISAFIIAFDLILFLSPFPWTCREYFDNSFTHDSFNAGMIQTRGLFLNRLASFSNLYGVKRVDELHQDVLATLRNEGADSGNLVLLDTWWHRWGYFYLPHSLIYDIRDFSNNDSLWIGRSEEYNRQVVEDRVIKIPVGKKVLLLLRKDHPAFSLVSSQVHLERIPLPEFLDIYRITDDHFSFRWKDVWFIKE